MEDLYKWNPLPKQQKPCMMKPGYRFCVQLRESIFPGHLSRHQPINHEQILPKKS